MSTIADYSVFTKAFLASNDVDFSKKSYPPNSQEQGNSLRYLAVVPLYLDRPLTPREALNFDWLKLGSDAMWKRVSCRNANGEFIGNIVRVQPGVREGSIRLVAKVAVTASGEDVSDFKANTFVLLRTDSILNPDLPIAVATISDGYRLHRHPVIGNDPLDDVENANYVSFTINHLNGYTSVDFNPDAYVTYDVTDALSRSVNSLHIAFDTASGDLKLLDKDGNIIDQANLPIKADVIIADGEEGYKYVKTDVKQDIHAAKAWMPGDSTAWETVPAVDYTMRHAALVVGKGSSRVFVDPKSSLSCPISKESVQLEHVVIDGSTYMLGDVTGSDGILFRVEGDAGSPQYNVTLSESSVTITDTSAPNPASYNVTSGNVTVDVVTINNSRYVLGETLNTGGSRYRTLSIEGSGAKFYGSIETREGSSTGGVVGITLDGQSMYTFEEGATTPSEFKDHSGKDVTWFGTKTIPEGYTLKYGLEAFVWTVKDADAEAGKEITDPFFQQLNASLLALGFHKGDDIALGTNLATLAPTEGVSPLNKVDADEYIHGKANKATREQEVDEQRAYAKEELVAWNAQRPALTANRQSGTIIDHTGLDVRNGRITLGCGRVNIAAEDGESPNVNYGIQMNDLSSNLDFTVSHTTGNVQFDDNGHAANLTSSTLLSIEAGSYISGAPTCLILAQVSRHEGGATEFYPVRTTTGFDCKHSYTEESGTSLTIHDNRKNISSVLTRNRFGKVPAIIEVQAIYTHPDAQSETVPAQQMHTYIGEWTTISDSEGSHPGCIFSCNKIEEWMAAVNLPNPTFDSNHELIEADVKLYVVIRVY